MKKIFLIHLGPGNVGKNLIMQITEADNILEDKYNVKLLFKAIFTSKRSYVHDEGIPADKASQIVENQYYPYHHKAEDIIKNTKSPFILIDTTASNDTFDIIKQTLESGNYAVLSNKKPLSSSQQLFDTLVSNSRPNLYYETTVGAGLPVIKTIQNMLDTGDKIMEIRGCFSGTLGYIFSQLDNRGPFSEIVKEAKELGYTEPDPRDDLSGVDVARKALILSRLIGNRIEMKDISLNGLFPEEFQYFSLDKFLKEIKSLDLEYTTKIRENIKNNKVFRYTAQVTGTTINIGLEKVDKTSDIGALCGPNNIIVIKSKYYYDHPLVIKGPGAGVQVTAAGVFGNIIDIIKTI